MIDGITVVAFVSAGFSAVASILCLFRISALETKSKLAAYDLDTLNRRVDGLWSTRDEVCDAIACRLNRLETKLDSEVVRLDKQALELASMWQTHEEKLTDLRLRTNGLGNKYWLPDEKVSFGVLTPVPDAPDHRTDELSQERDEAQDTASSLYVTPPGFEEFSVGLGVWNKPEISTEETAQ